MTYQASEADRRLSNIVSVGTIAVLDAANATVTVTIGDITTEPLPWITGRAGNDRSWWAPEPGEQVIVLAPSGDLAQGWVLPAGFQDAHPAPGDTADVHRTVYADGSIVEYDRAAHQLKIDVSAASGSVLIICKTATVQASEKVLVDTPDAEFTGNVLVQKTLTYMGGMAGSNVNGPPGAAATIQGDFRAANGAFEHNGVNVGSTHTHTERGDGNEVSPPH